MKYEETAVSTGSGQVVHLLAFLELQLDANLADGLVLWEQAFVAARQQWELGRARQLLALVKRYGLAPRQRAVIRTLAGQLQAQQADWAGAVAAYEQSLQLWPEQVDTLSSLGNGLRRGLLKRLWLGNLLRHR